MKGRDFEFPADITKVLLRGRLVAPENLKPPYPLVMMLTGDGPKGTKSPSWLNFPPILSSEGIASFLFDFEGLGHSDGDRQTLTLTKGIANFRTAFRFLSEQHWVDMHRIGVFASSFGATVLLMSPSTANKFRAIGLKSPAPFLPDAYLSEIGLGLFDRWASAGYLDKNGYRFEVLTDSLQYNAYGSARGITKPCLITHGDIDEIVPVIQSKYLAKCLAGPTELKIFEGVGHGYAEDNSWDRMARLFANWFVKAL
jgi:uncharacterized protein